MKRKKLHIDRMDGSMNASAGSSFGGMSPSGNSGGSSGGTITTGTPSGNSGGIGTGSSTSSADIGADIGAGIGSNDPIAEVPTSTNPSAGGSDNRAGGYTIIGDVVSFDDGTSVSITDLTTLIGDYYGKDRLMSVGMALSDPDFLAYLRQKIKKKKAQKGGDELPFGQRESGTPSSEVPDPSGSSLVQDSWTLFGVTMKKGYWIFMAAGLILLLIILAIVALLKRK